MNLPLNSPLPHNSADPPTPRQNAIVNWELARVAAAIVKAKAASTCMASPSSFSGVSPLAPTVVQEAQAVASNQQQIRGMVLAPASLQQGGGGAVISDADLAAAPQVVPLNSISDTQVMRPARPKSVARRNMGVVWANPATTLPASPGCSARNDSGSGLGKTLFIAVAVALGLWVISE